MDPNLNKQMYAKKPTFFQRPNPQMKFRPRVETEKAPVGETAYENIANTIDYYLSRNFMEDGLPDPYFTLLENANQANYPSYTMRGYPHLGICDKLQDSFRYADKKALNSLIWAPNGKKVLVGTSKGEISFIDGAKNNQDTLLLVQQKGKAIKSMTMTKNNKHLLVGDEDGFIKYLDTNYKQIKEVRSDVENDQIKEISIAPTDMKFVTASNDNDLRIWDFEKNLIDTKLKGHKNDINCVKWHPNQGLIVSGSKDATTNFWDPRSGERLTTFMNHKQSVSTLQWNSNGNWLLSGSKDQSIILYDLRTLKEIQSFIGFNSEIEEIAWNTFHERLFAVGTKSGTISFWLTGEKDPASNLNLAHSFEKKDIMEPGVKSKNQPPTGAKITALAWNPTGDQLASAGLDSCVKFWGRPKPEIIQAFDPTTTTPQSNQMIPEEPPMN